jgi:putative phosphoesterase
VDDVGTLAEVRIGLIADTHGFLGDDVVESLAGCDFLLHAGDVGPGVLWLIERVAETVAVRGNNDLAGPEAELPLVAWVEVAGVRIAVVHRLVDSPRDGFDILVFGHCHRQHDYLVDGRRYINPGAAGRRGFHARRSAAILEERHGEWGLRFIDLGARVDAARLAVRS